MTQTRVGTGTTIVLSRYDAAGRLYETVLDPEGAEYSSGLVTGFDLPGGSQVVFRLMPFVLRLVVARIGLLLAGGDHRNAEIFALRHRVLVLQRCPAFNDAGRTVLGVLPDPRSSAARSGVPHRQGRHRAPVAALGSSPATGSNRREP